MDGLIINCSAFNPTPSLSAVVVNHFKFKSSIRTFNLSGMGCAASIIAVDMAREMLKARACNNDSSPVIRQGKMESSRRAPISHPQAVRARSLLCFLAPACTGSAPLTCKEESCMHAVSSSPGLTPNHRSS